MKLKRQYFGHLMLRANSLEKTLIWEGLRAGGERAGEMEDEMVDCITDSMDMSLSQLQMIVKGREAWRAAVHGVVKSQT